MSQDDTTSAPAWLDELIGALQRDNAMLKSIYKNHISQDGVNMDGVPAWLSNMVGLLVIENEAMRQAIVAAQQAHEAEHGHSHGDATEPHSHE